MSKFLGKRIRIARRDEEPSAAFVAGRLAELDGHSSAPFAGIMTRMRWRDGGLHLVNGKTGELRPDLHYKLPSSARSQLTTDNSQLRHEGRPDRG